MNTSTVSVPNLINEFFAAAKKENTEFHNEACLQLELAVFLRKRLPVHKILLEIPVTHFTGNKRPVGVKKEIDICIIDNAYNKLAAIELKFPQNGQTPETLFNYCKDIEFCEFLTTTVGFTGAYALMLTDDHSFWQGRKSDGIYRYFRGKSPQPINETIQKPTGKKNTHAKLKGTYSVKWANEFGDFRSILTKTENS